MDTLANYLLSIAGLEKLKSPGKKKLLLKCKFNMAFLLINYLFIAKKKKPFSVLLFVTNISMKSRNSNK